MAIIQNIAISSTDTMYHDKKTYQFRLNPELHADAKETARLRSMTLSDYVAHCIDRDMASQKDSERLDVIIQLLNTLINQLK